MAVRCPDCNKFASYDGVEAETMDESIDGVTFYSSVRVYLPCADCGTELKEYTFEVEQELIHDCTMVGPELQIASWDVNGSDRREFQDAKGRPINPRYQKTFYGYEGSLKWECPECGFTDEVDLRDDAQASYFEQLV